MKLPRDVDYNCLAKILRRRGWKPIRIRGSHVRYENTATGRKVTIPMYNYYTPGLLLDLLAEIGLSREDFIKLYKEYC